MKLHTILCVILATFSANGQLSGTITVGPAGTYSDLSTAFSAINTSGVSGSLTVSIVGDFNEPGTTALTRSDLSSVNNVIIRPASSTFPVITVQGSNGIDVNGASYVVIDGSNSGGTTRDLTVKRSSTASGSTVIYLRGASSSVITVKNCILGDATNPPDYAVRVEGPGTVEIQNNEIHGIGNANGIIYFSSVNGASNLITENSISGDQSGSSKAYGIYLAGGGATMTISKNTLHLLRTSGGGGISGIRGQMAAGTLNVTNNFIGGGFVSTSTSDYFLIELPGSAVAQVYHNTLVLNSIAGSPFDAAGFYIQSGTGEFRNNIVYNNFDDGASYCIYNGLSTAEDLLTNHNDLYAPGAQNSVGYDGIFTYDQLSDWKAWPVVSPDQNSVSVAVTFSNIADNFHLSGASNGDTQLRGTNGLAADDIDGDTRLTNPDGPYMGADEGSTALPVQLSGFMATAGSGLTAELRWTTASELDNYGFEIERRTISQILTDTRGFKSENDGIWSRIGFVQGSGTSSAPKEYSFVDKLTTPGRYAYRLKQVDRSGSFEYIGSVEIEIGIMAPKFILEENYPNPFNPSTTINFSVKETGKATLIVFNLLGQEVAELFSGAAESGRLYQVQFDGTSLPSGLYIARLRSGNDQNHLRMILAK